MHECPIRNCTQLVPDHILMCRRHWGMVPRSLQHEVYDRWKHRSLSRPYLVVRQRAIAAVEDLAHE